MVPVRTLLGVEAGGGEVWCLPGAQFSLRRGVVSLRLLDPLPSTAVVIALLSVNPVDVPEDSYISSKRPKSSFTSGASSWALTGAPAGNSMARAASTSRHPRRRKGPDRGWDVPMTTGPERAAVSDE